MKQIVKTLKIFIIAIVACAIIVIVPHNSVAGITVYEDDEKYVAIGGRIQLQYYSANPDSGDTDDKLFFRRFRPYIEGTLYKDWIGKFQFDLGSATDSTSGSNEVAIKDAYMKYKGFKDISIIIGNANFRFSRELITSSKYQQLIERTFVGDHNYGTPDRNTGVHITGSLADKKITYGLSGASAVIDPDHNKLDFDTPINEMASDFNEGWMYGGRVEFHPFGPMKFSQGDFGGDTKAVIGVGGFSWNNDDDNNTYTAAGVSTSTSKADVDSVYGFEASGGFRFMGISIDAQYNRFEVETIDNSYTGGIYRNGETTLESFSVEGGYMIISDRLEIVGGYSLQDADNYATEWTRTSFGANLFLHKHYIKLQFTYRMGEDLKGERGVDEDEAFVQAQFVF